MCVSYEISDILCGQPPAVRHAAIKDLTQMEMFSPMNYQDGDKVYYQCNDGYQMFTNTNYVTCSNGEWVGATPLCSEFYVYKQKLCHLQHCFLIFLVSGHVHISPTGDRSIPKIYMSGEIVSHLKVSHPNIFAPSFSPK